jgi:hypothetical protein
VKAAENGLEVDFRKKYKTARPLSRHLFENDEAPARCGGFRELGARTDPERRTREHDYR